MTPLLQRFFQVRKGEGAAVFASALCFFFILTALMVIRPARESLGMRRGIEAVRWLFIGTAVVTLAVNPIFALLVSRYRRIVFMTATETDGRAGRMSKPATLWGSAIQFNCPPGFG